MNGLQDTMIYYFLENVDIRVISDDVLNIVPFDAFIISLTIQ